jgi:hypothetical protein
MGCGREYWRGGGGGGLAKGEEGKRRTFRGGIKQESIERGGGYGYSLYGWQVFS